MCFSFSSRRTPSLLAPFVAVAAILSGGCNLTTGTADRQLLGESEVAPVSVSTYTVEIRKRTGKSKIAELSVEEAAWINDAAVQSGATRRFRHLKGIVVRTTDRGEQLRMKAEWNRAHKAFSIETDFALHPGDHVIFIEDTSTPFDDMFEAIFGSMGR